MQKLVMFNGPPQSYKSTRGNELQVLLDQRGESWKRVGATDPFMVPLVRLMENLTGEYGNLPYYYESDIDERCKAYEQAKAREVANVTGRQILIDMIEGIRERDPDFITRVMCERVERAFAAGIDWVIIDNVGFFAEWHQLTKITNNTHLSFGLFYFSEKRWSEKDHTYDALERFVGDNRVCLQHLAQSVDPSAQEIIDSFGV